MQFWRSVDLTGNQTEVSLTNRGNVFWRSVDLTGNQTLMSFSKAAKCFGAVSI